MKTHTIAILGTGDMGSAVGRCLADNGLKAVTCLDGRSERSKDLARDAGMEDRAGLEAMLADADMLLSIVPPAAALRFAEQMCPLISASGRDVLFVDCNAIAPTTTCELAAIAANNGVRFQDVGIIGASPRPGRMPVRFYTSGPHNAAMKQLAAELIEIRPIGDDIGRASGIKMVYASLTKGTHALRAAAAIAGERLGVGDEIRHEWQRSLGDTWAAMLKRLPILACDSGRWSGEMREIAKTYDSLGLPPSFHEGAEWIYELLSKTDLATESRDEAHEKNRSIEEVLEQFLATFTANRR